MHSIKPGRGPSLLGGLGGIIAIGFGIFWTIAASSIGAPGFFTMFGVIFVIAAIVITVYNFYNAASRNRMSAFDITSGNEEVDPIAKSLGFEDKPPDAPEDKGNAPRKYPGKFCPFCGEKVTEDFDFCPGCGKDI